MSQPVPVFFEAIPPPAGRPEALSDLLRRFEPLSATGVAGVFVPEVLDGEYSTVDPSRFAAALRSQSGFPVFVDRITVTHSAAALQQWARQSKALGISGFILVGGASQAQAKPGCSVEEALHALAGQAPLGVVTIPTRRRPLLDEPERLLRKAAAGAQFAVSQILAEPRQAVALVRDLAEAARQTGIAPPRIDWSLAPLTSQRDATFLQGLGVALPSGLQAQIVALEPARRPAHSQAHNLDVARTVLDACEAHAIPAGLCASHVTLRNIEAALDLAQALRDETRSRRNPSGRGARSAPERTLIAAVAQG